MQVELPAIWLGESRERRLITRSDTGNEGGRIVLTRSGDSQAPKVAVAS